MLFQPRRRTMTVEQFGAIGVASMCHGRAFFALFDLALVGADIEFADVSCHWARQFVRTKCYAH